MKFGVCTDLHYDAIPDGDERIAKLIRDFQEKKVDFILELGDLCNPTEENKRILTAFRAAGIPCHYSIGNHNTDFCSPERVLQFFGLKSGYYAIVHEAVKFLFLDANYIKTKTGYLPECKKNLLAENGQCPYVPPEQIDWLKSEIADDRYFYVVCSHQSLFNDHMVGSHHRGIVNRQEVRTVLEARNARSRKVLFCINGNDHGDALKQINGIYYYSLNSASYIWHGVKQTYPYSGDIHDKYPQLKNMILYREPLHAVITIDKNTVKVEGMKGHYQNVTPKDVGIGHTWNGVSIKAQTSSLSFTVQE